MTDLYIPKGQPRERILGYGGSGAGKTKAWLDIALAYENAGLEGTFYALDTDYAVERMLYDGFPGLAKSGRVIFTNPIEWTDYEEFGESLRRKMTDDDWCIVDLMDEAWEEVQNHYSMEVYGKTKGQHFLTRRKEMKNPNKENTFEGSTDWNIIKPLYAAFNKNIFYAHKGHTFVAAAAAAVNRGGGMFGDKAEVLEVFGHVGMKPLGNKKLMHNLHTALLFTQTKDGWRLTTAKDRERTMLKNEDIDNFAQDYLVDVAGWRKPKKKLTVAERKKAVKKKRKGK